jgi:hypothetical protein
MKKLLTLALLACAFVYFSPVANAASNTAPNGHHKHHKHHHHHHGNAA